METDASNYVTAGLLSQPGKDGMLHPVAYRSKTMTKAECNYDVHDKELLAIMKALEDWRRYVSNTEHRITILTDHQNLVPFMTTKKLVGRQIRWMEILSQYYIKIEYGPGREGGKPDALTRREGDLPKNNDQQIRQRERTLVPKEQYFEAIETVEIQSKEKELLQAAAKQDSEQQAIKKALEEGKTEMKGVVLGLCQWKDDLLWYQGKIWTPNEDKLRVELIKQHHDIPTTGHGGTAKTTELIKRKYYWPHMRDLIKEYVKNCDMCQRTKAVRHAPYGLVQPNEVPEKPWKSISMDFITDLPKSEGYDATLVVIDRLTIMSHFIPWHKDMNARQFATSFIKEIFRLHGLPKDIITDRGTIFTSDLWKETTKLLEIERRLSTAFHPQTDRQTERTNATLEQYLRAYSSYQQDNWCELLPTAEFAYNNGYQETIKHTHFFANYGINPEYEAIGHMMQGNVMPLEQMSQLHDVLQAEMSEAQIRQQEYYDQHRKPDPNLKSGDIVWLLTRNIRTTRPCKKLDYKKIGPFRILAKIGSNAYKLDLPDTMKIHNTIHISLLEPYEDNKLPSQRQEPPPPIIIEEEPEYELEEIVDARLYYGKLQYRAKWSGYSPEHDKVWYPASNFENAVNAKQLFHERYPEKASQDRHYQGRQQIDLSTSITTNISTRNTTHLSANKPRLLSDEKPHTIQMPRGGNELDGVHRRCMPNTQNRQGKHLLSTNPTTKQVACWSLRMGTDMRNATTNDGTLRVQPRTTRGTKDDQRGPPKEKGTRWTNPLDEVLQGRVLATQGGKNKKSPLPQKTDTQGKKGERMGKGHEDTPFGGGERKNPSRCRSLPKANTRTAGRTGQKQENDCQPRDECRKPEKDYCKLSLRAGKGRKRSKDPPSSNGEIRGPQKPCQASWVEVVRFGKLALWDQC